MLSEEFKIPDNIKIGKVDILFCHPGAAEAILSDSGRELLKMTTFNKNVKAVINEADCMDTWYVLYYTKILAGGAHLKQVGLFFRQG